MTKRERLARQGGKYAYCRADIYIDSDDPHSVATWDEIIPVSHRATI